MARIAVMKYTLRKSKETDFEFVFQLNKADMRRSVELLRGWNEDAERDDMRRHFVTGKDQIIVVDGRDVGRLAVDRYPASWTCDILRFFRNIRGAASGLKSPRLFSMRHNGWKFP